MLSGVMSRSKELKIPRSLRACRFKSGPGHQKILSKNNKLELIRQVWLPAWGQRSTSGSTKCCFDGEVAFIKGLEFRDFGNGVIPITESGIRLGHQKRCYDFARPPEGLRNLVGLLNRARMSFMNSVSVHQ